MDKLTKQGKSHIIIIVSQLFSTVMQLFLSHSLKGAAQAVIETGENNNSNKKANSLALTENWKSILIK